MFRHWQLYEYSRRTEVFTKTSGLQDNFRFLRKFQVSTKIPGFQDNSRFLLKLQVSSTTQSFCYNTKFAGQLQVFAPTVGFHENSRFAGQLQVSRKKTVSDSQWSTCRTEIFPAARLMAHCLPTSIIALLLVIHLVYYYQGPISK